MTNHPNRNKKIAIYTRSEDGTLSRTTSGLTEAQYIARINAEGRGHLGGAYEPWSTNDKTVGELMGWPERYVHWYGDRFAVATINM